MNQIPIILEFEDLDGIHRVEVFQGLYFDDNNHGYPKRYCINTHEVDIETYEIAKRKIVQLYKTDMNVCRFYIPIS